MGVTPFRYTGRRIQLSFPGHETLDGLEIETSSINMSGIMKVLALTAGIKADSADDFSADDMAAVNALLGIFVRSVKAWNFTDDDGHPVPISKDALDVLDLDDIMHIMGEWQERLVKVPAPLDRLPKDTEPVQVELPPMESW